MTWQVRSLIGLIATCLTLLSIAGFVNSQTYQTYRSDLEDNRRECQAERNAESGKKSKECQSVLYRTFDDPVALLTGALTLATIALFVVTLGLFIAAARQGADAKEAVGITRETAVSQLRAYIGAESLSITARAPGQYWEATLIVKNFGQTPAKKFRCHIFMTCREEPLQSSFEETCITGLEKTETLMPGGTSAMVMRHPIRTVAEFERRISRSEVAVYVYGTIFYEDIFGNIRHTNIRQLSHGSRALTSNPFILAEGGNETS